jgi:hypothetical protein
MGGRPEQMAIHDWIICQDLDTKINTSLFAMSEMDMHVWLICDPGTRLSNESQPFDCSRELLGL